MMIVLFEIFMFTGLGWLIWTRRESMIAFLKNHETKAFEWIQKKWSRDIFDVLYAGGKTVAEAEAWVERQWFFFKIILVVALFFVFLTGKWQWPMFFMLLCGIPFHHAYFNLQKRRAMILRRLTFVLDMLILNLESGLDFLSSLEELVRMETRHPLHQEIKITLQSIHLGNSRSESFLKMAERTKIPELRSLAQVIQQSETAGSSLTELLRMQSHELRHRLLRIAEAQAQKTPVKILAPLLLFIFPVVFVLLFVPIGIQMLQYFD